MNGIYGYKDLKTGYIVYIGRDSYIDKNNRKSDHMSTKGRKRQQIDKVLQKNPDRYKHFIIKKGKYTNEELNILESHYIDFYGTYTNRKRHEKRYGFNFTKGGEGKSKKIRIRSIDLYKLKEKVLSQDLKWNIIDYSKAEKLCNEHNLDIGRLK